MILVIPTLHYYPDNPNGADRLAFEEAKHLAKRGHEVWLIGQDARGKRPELSIEDEVHVLRYPSPKLSQFDPRRIQAHQVSVCALLKRHLKMKPDLVHGHSLLAYAGALELYKGSTACCFSVHSPVKPELKANSIPGFGARANLALSTFFNNRIERRCLEQSDRITVFSNYTKTLLGKYHGNGFASNAHVIPGWVDMKQFRIIPNREAAKSELGWRLDAPVFFTLRRLVPRMGLDRLLYAARDVKESGYDFQIVIGGSGPMRIELETLVRELGLEAEINFEGFVPEERLPLMYGAADAFILPTLELECFGLIALEALACGRPVLATPVAAIPELLNRFEPRWLAADASASAIAQILIDYMEHRLPFHEPEKVRQSVSQEFERKVVLGKMESLLTEKR